MHVLSDVLRNRVALRLSDVTFFTFNYNIITANELATKEKHYYLFYS